ncbi:MAG: type II secretion system protein M [Proteobacteria bacterium]|nr:type II secretion system protein M [Pseudomonadota bacterium]
MIKEYWYNLSEKDRLTASIGLVCLSLYLFYILIYSPITNKIQFLNQQLVEKKETLSFLQKAKGTEVGPKKEAINNSNLLRIIASQLEESKFKHFKYHLQQTNTGDIQLAFDEVPFIQFLLWLFSLQTHYDIQIKQFTAEKTETQGLVKLMIILSAATKV